MSAEHKALLEKQLWGVATELRGQMDASEYQKYVLGVIFYKYLSEMTETKILETINPGDEDKTVVELWNNKDDYDHLPEYLLEELGFVITPNNLYSSLLVEINKGSQGSWTVDSLDTAFNDLTASTVGNASQNDFQGLFDDINLNSNSLGVNIKERNRRLGEILKKIGEIDFHLDDAEFDVLGDAYEYLIGQFASGSGKKGGEFYTPQSVSTLVSRILSYEKPDMKSIYDPTCGSGSLLLRMAKESKKTVNRLKIYGQELNTTTFNLARMNMILHGVDWSNFEIKNDNTLTEDKFPGRVFDVIGANPPYSITWEHTDALRRDPRFTQAAKLAPQSKADFAFVQHIVHHLSEDGGTAAVVLPHGVLFRGAAEGEIRKQLLENNLVHAIIGLPKDLFFGTSIPTAIIVLKKGRAEDDNILFINAENEFVKQKNKNALTDANIDTIFDTYTQRKDKAGFSSLVTLETIKENDYNLNIPRYVDNSAVDEQIDLKAVNESIKAINARQNAVNRSIDSYLSELESDTLASIDSRIDVDDFVNNFVVAPDDLGLEPKKVSLLLLKDTRNNFEETIVFAVKGLPNSMPYTRNDIKWSNYFKADFRVVVEDISETITSNNYVEFIRSHLLQEYNLVIDFNNRGVNPDDEVLHLTLPYSALKDRRS